MTATDATQFLPAPAWEDPRVHLLDDSWLLTIFAILLAVGLPWLLSGLNIDLVAACAGLLALGVIHIAFTTLAGPGRSSLSWRRRALPVLQAVGVLLTGFIWQHAGGLQNPAYLLVFALPVISSIFLSRWQPYLMAVLAILAVATVALGQAPELRWYVPGLNATAPWFTTASAETSGPFPGFYAPSGYFVVMLEVFAILLIACAVAAEYVGAVFERLHAQVFAARAEAERGQELWAALIEDLPIPSLLIDADTLQVICASREVAPQFCAQNTPLPGRTLFEAIHFSWPEVVQELIAGRGGMAPLCTLRVGEQLRVAEVRVQHLAQKGRRFALIMLIDHSADWAFKAALDAADYAALVLDARGRVLAFNKPALGLFSGISAGADAAQLLPQSPSAAPWWEPGLSGRRKTHIEILQRLYQMTASAIALPGEETQLTVLAFRPAPRAATTQQTGSYPVPNPPVLQPASTSTTPVTP